MSRNRQEAPVRPEDCPTPMYHETHTYCPSCLWTLDQVDPVYAAKVSDSKFLGDVKAELERARQKHAPINSAHEGYAVILEEVDEFWLEVKKRREARDPEAVYRELVQVAAMAARTATDTVKWEEEQA